MYDIDLHSRVALYEQVYNRILEQIIGGKLKVNEQLPSVRTLALELGINPNTVSKTYQLLEREGLIYSLAGRGSFVAEFKKDSLKEKALQKFDVSVTEAVHVGATEEELTGRIKQILA